MTLMSALPQVSRIMSPLLNKVDDDPQAVILTTLGASLASSITTPFSSLAASLIVIFGLATVFGIIIYH